MFLKGAPERDRVHVLRTVLFGRGAFRGDGGGCDEPTTSNEENNEQVSMPVSRSVTMPSHVPIGAVHVPFSGDTLRLTSPSNSPTAIPVAIQGVSANW